MNTKEIYEKEHYILYSPFVRLMLVLLSSRLLISAVAHPVCICQCFLGLFIHFICLSFILSIVSRVSILSPDPLVYTIRLFIHSFCLEACVLSTPLCLLCQSVPIWVMRVYSPIVVGG